MVSLWDEILKSVIVEVKMEQTYQLPVATAYEHNIIREGIMA